MVNEKLVSYIKTGNERGFEISLLKDNLINQGWPMSEVDAAALKVIASSRKEKPIKSKISNEDFVQKPMVEKERIPTGVKIVSFLYFLQSAFMVFVIVRSLSLGGQFAAVTVAIASFFVIVFVLMGVGLWKAKSWSRFVAIILGLIGLVVGIFSLGNLQTAIPLIVVNAFILIVLLLSKKVKKFFKK